MITEYGQCGSSIDLTVADSLRKGRQQMQQMIAWFRHGACRTISEAL
jgi:hypothetical protein